MTQGLEFTRDDERWVTVAVLPTWKGPQYSDYNLPEIADGSVEIVFAPEGRDDSPLTDVERASVSWFVENEALVSQAALRALLGAYPPADDYGYSPEEMAERMPEVSSLAEYRRLVSLQVVFVHPLVRGGIPYVGLQLACSWEEEHGLGILMHGERVVEIGGADTAFLLWVAKRDAKAHARR